MKTVMLGFTNAADAKRAFLARNRRARVRSVAAMTVGQLKGWLANDLDVVPFAEVVAYDPGGDPAPIAGPAAVEPLKTKAPTFTPLHELSKPRQEHVAKAVEWLGSRLADHHEERLRQVKVQHSKTRDGGYDRGVIDITPHGGPGEVVHEFGHHLETDPWAKAKVQAFEAKRFGKEKPKPFNKLIADKQIKNAPTLAERDRLSQAVQRWRGVFKDTDTGRSDAMDKLFDDPYRAHYVGRKYGDGDTEILSMGLELMHENPEKFATIDPEYFELIDSILKGKGKSKPQGI